jgi:hypothetical protein
MIRRSLDLSPPVQKVYAFVRQSASTHCPVPLANLIGRAGSGGHEAASRAQSDAVRPRACRGGKT